MFLEYLSRISPDKPQLIEQFDLYHRVLLETNQKVNLISRQTEPELYWTFHFLDSLLPLSLGFDFNDKIVLDLGSGGGLPGIPLAIANPQGCYVLMDSREKKVLELKNMIKLLDLNNCYPISKRLEEFKWSDLDRIKKGIKSFDCIVCRSVKITPKLLKKMKDLLSEEGFILLYKGKVIEESWLLTSAVTTITGLHPWGERTFIKINKI